MTESLTEAWKSDLRPNTQVSTTVTARGHFIFFSLLFLNCSRIFCLHPVVIFERAGVQHTQIHMIHTQTGGRAQTLEYISVTKNDSCKIKTKRKQIKRGRGSDYKSTTRVEADSESGSSLSDSVLDVPQDFFHLNMFCQTEKEQ